VRAVEDSVADRPDEIFQLRRRCRARVLLRVLKTLANVHQLINSISTVAANKFLAERTTPLLRDEFWLHAVRRVTAN